MVFRGKICCLEDEKEEEKFTVKQRKKQIIQFFYNDVKKCTQLVKTTKRLTGHLFSKGTHNQKCGNKFKKHSTQRGEGINNTQRLHVII